MTSGHHLYIKRERFIQSYPFPCRLVIEATSDASNPPMSSTWLISDKTRVCNLQRELSFSFNVKLDVEAVGEGSLRCRWVGRVHTSGPYGDSRACRSDDFAVARYVAADVLRVIWGDVVKPHD